MTHLTPESHAPGLAEPSISARRRPGQRDPAQRIVNTLRELESAQKPGDTVPAYTRWANRRLGRYGAAVAVRWGWTANNVSQASALLSLLGLTALIVLPPVPSTGVAAAFLFASGYVLDSADGQVARVTGTGGPAGEWLDHVIDAVRVPAIHLAVAIGVIRLEGISSWTIWIPVIFCLLAVGHFMGQILAEQLLRRSGSGTGAETGPGPGSGREQAVSGRSLFRSFIMLPIDSGMLCWIFLAWGYPAVFMGLYSVLLLANAVVIPVSLRRKYQMLLRPLPIRGQV